MTPKRHREVAILILFVFLDLIRGNYLPLSEFSVLLFIPHIRVENGYPLCWFYEPGNFPSLEDYEG